MKLTALAILTVLACAAQSFDVASIKPTPPPDGIRRSVGPRGGPGTSDPELFTCGRCSLAFLLTLAYDVKAYQLSGLDHVKEERFDISAKVPPGIDAKVFRLMQQNLLRERFKLAVHHENREMPSFELVVAKSGAKIKESGTDAKANFFWQGGRMRAVRAPMDNLIWALSTILEKPVFDATALRGNYDFTLIWNADNGFDVDSPSLVTAIQEQLGLKLESTKRSIDTVVVDHVERVPTEN